MKTFSQTHDLMRSLHEFWADLPEVANRLKSV